MVQQLALRITQKGCNRTEEFTFKFARAVICDLQQQMQTSYERITESTIYHTSHEENFQNREIWDKNLGERLCFYSSYKFRVKPKSNNVILLIAGFQISSEMRENLFFSPVAIENVSVPARRSFLFKHGGL